EANIDRLRARGVELQQELAALRRKLDVPVQSKYNWPTGEGKILFLPVGRLRSVYPPAHAITWNERFAALLNLHALAIFNKNRTPFFDLMHDEKTRIFQIAKFEFEPEGVFAYGQFTPIGRTLRDAGRISGVSPTIPVSGKDQKPPPAYGEESI